MPVSVHGKLGSLLITSHPNDEIAEIWDGIVTQLEVGSVIALRAVPGDDDSGRPRASAAPVPGGGDGRARKRAL